MQVVATAIVGGLYVLLSARSCPRLCSSIYRTPQLTEIPPTAMSLERASTEEGGKLLCSGNGDSFA